MPKEIVAAADLLMELEKRYAGLRYDLNLFKPWFAKDKKLFFDCGKTEDRNACLKKVLTRQDLEQFAVLSVVKEEEKDTGKTIYTINESRFCRIGKERPEDFINRYNKNLQESVTLSMQLFNLQPVELIGFSYVSPEDRAELLRNL